MAWQNVSHEPHTALSSLQAKEESALIEALMREPLADAQAGHIRVCPPPETWLVSVVERNSNAEAPANDIAKNCTVDDQGPELTSANQCGDSSSEGSQTEHDARAPADPADLRRMKLRTKN